MLLFKSFHYINYRICPADQGCRFFCRGKFCCSKTSPDSFYDHRDDHRSHGNQSSRMRRQRDCLPHRQ